MHIRECINKSRSLASARLVQTASESVIQLTEAPVQNAFVSSSDSVTASSYTHMLTKQTFSFLREITWRRYGNYAIHNNSTHNILPLLLIDHTGQLRVTTCKSSHYYNCYKSSLWIRITFSTIDTMRKAFSISVASASLCTQILRMMSMMFWPNFGPA